MNPMSDRGYRVWRANELSREIARETQFTAARLRKPIGSNPRLPTFMQKLFQQITMIWTAVHKEPRHDRPASHCVESVACNESSSRVLVKTYNPKPKT